MLAVQHAGYLLGTLGALIVAGCGLSRKFGARSWRSFFDTYCQEIPKHPEGLGVIACLLWWFFNLVQLLSPTLLLLAICDVPRSDVKRHARAVDTLILAVDLELALAAWAYKGHWLVSVAVALRLVEIVQANIVRHVMRAEAPPPSNHFRTIMMALWNYAELGLGFALLYWGRGGISKVGFTKAVYFSFITQLTVGYGDIHPTTPFAAAMAVVQAAIGLLFVAVLVGRFVALVPLPASNRHVPDGCRRCTGEDS